MIKRNILSDGTVQNESAAEARHFELLGFVIPSYMPAFSKFVAYKQKRYTRFGRHTNYKDGLRQLVYAYADLYRCSNGDPEEAMRLVNELIKRRIYQVTDQVLVREGNVIKEVKI